MHNFLKQLEHDVVNMGTAKSIQVSASEAKSFLDWHKRTTATMEAGIEQQQKDLDSAAKEIETLKKEIHSLQTADIVIVQ